jgi:hypothetical protein
MEGSMNPIEKMLEFLASNVDIITSFTCFIGALTCVYLSAIILRERTPWVDVQRISLGALGLALFANGIFDYPEWALVNGHRPTGTFVDITLTVNLVVMAVRGGVMYQPRLPRRDVSS